MQIDVQKYNFEIIFIKLKKLVYHTPYEIFYI